jgi:uncharacterized Zn-binding protein involved in type VI secretion
MPEAARGNGVDTVASPDGSGFCCGSPSTQRTAACSPNVFANSIGIVRQGDPMVVHPFPGPCCTPHAPVLSTFSGTVYINGKKAGRKGDAYGGDHITSSGSSTVFIGG